MHMIDANKEWKISKEERVAYQTRMFKALDKNGDGFLTPGGVALRARERAQFRCCNAVLIGESRAAALQRKLGECRRDLPARGPHSR